MSEYYRYQEIYRSRYKKCKSKKDYKKLCKDMLLQLDVIDRIDENQFKIISQMVGEEGCYEILALAIKMYVLDKQGIPYEMISVEDPEDM